MKAPALRFFNVVFCATWCLARGVYLAASMALHEISAATGRKRALVASTCSALARSIEKLAAGHFSFGDYLPVPCRGMQYSCTTIGRDGMAAMGNAACRKPMRRLLSGGDVLVYEHSADFCVAGKLAVIINGIELRPGV